MRNEKALRCEAETDSDSDSDSDNDNDNSDSDSDSDRSCSIPYESSYLYSFYPKQARREMLSSCPLSSPFSFSLPG